MLDAVLESDHGVEGVAHPFAQLEIGWPCASHTPALQGFRAHGPSGGQVSLGQHQLLGHGGFRGSDDQGTGASGVGVASSIGNSFRRVWGQRCYFRKSMGN